MEIRTIGGFCYGVAFAYKQVMQLTRKYPDKQITLIGKLVHNEDVLEKLRENGVLTVNSIDDLFSLKTEKPILPIMRAHGSTIAQEERVQKKFGPSGYIDLTCKFVKSGPQNAAKAFSDKGYKVVIFGSATHPEALGIASRAKKTVIYNSPDEVKASDFAQGESIGVVAQTTTEIDKFYVLVNKLKGLGLNVEAVDTYCDATKRNQKGVKEIGSWADLILVVGGIISSNTQKLADICKRYTTTYVVENSKEVMDEWFKEEPQKIGIAAGASTPQWVIQEVRQKVESYYR